MGGESKKELLRWVFKKHSAQAFQKVTVTVAKGMHHKTHAVLSLRGSHTEGHVRALDKC